MKKTFYLFSVFVFVFITNVFGQKPTMTLTFTAENNGQHVPLNSILIENLTQGGDTTLYESDTVIALNYEIGINEDNVNGGKIFSLSQNYPNPIKGKTTISLYLPENEIILLTVSDMIGRELISKNTG